MKQSYQLLSILVYVVSVAGIIAWTAPRLRASEPETEASPAVTATMLLGSGFTPDWVTVRVHTNGDGELVKMEATCRYGRQRARFTPDGVFLRAEVDYRRGPSLPTSDWQRALDCYLVKVRTDFKRTQPVFWIDGPLPDSLQSRILDIAKRRGFVFLTEPPRQTGYAAPATQNF
jgi:hypothetical protein